MDSTKIDYGRGLQTERRSQYVVRAREREREREREQERIRGRI